MQAAGKELLKKGMSVLHESLADYILINPGCTLGEMGGHFGYTGSWLCSVINTDMFKAYMATRRMEVSACIAEDLPTRLHAAAHLATERIVEVLEKSEDADTIIDCFDKILHRYGYAPNAKGGAQSAVVNNTQNNVFYLDKKELAESKKALIEAHLHYPVEELVVLNADSA